MGGHSKFPTYMRIYISHLFQSTINSDAFNRRRKWQYVEVNESTDEIKQLVKKISDKFAGARQVAWNYRTLGHGVSTGQSPRNLRVTKHEDESMGRERVRAESTLDY